MEIELITSRHGDSWRTSACFRSGKWRKNNILTVIKQTPSIILHSLRSHTMMRAQRKRRRSDDPFFIPGDNLALQNPGNIVISYIEETQDFQQDESKERGENDATEYYEPPLPFSCCAPHCNERFTTLQESQTHYEAQHRFECAECGAIYPNEHLLDIVSEAIVCVLPQSFFDVSTSLTKTNLMDVFSTWKKHTTRTFKLLWQRVNPLISV